MILALDFWKGGEPEYQEKNRKSLTFSVVRTT